MKKTNKGPKVGQLWATKSGLVLRITSIQGEEVAGVRHHEEVAGAITLRDLVPATLEQIKAYLGK